MSGESVVSSAVPAATTRTTSFKGSSPSSKYVKLNVGGALYYTTMQTLTKQDTMLKAMFSGRMEVLTDSEGKFWWSTWAHDFPVLPFCFLTHHWPIIAGWILIDRCGKHFGTILNYLRDGAVPLPDSRRETEELLAEAKYYLVQGLADECTAALQVPTPPSVLEYLQPKSHHESLVVFFSKIRSSQSWDLIFCYWSSIFLAEITKVAFINNFNGLYLYIYFICYPFPRGGLPPNFIFIWYANSAFSVYTFFHISVLE